MAMIRSLISTLKRSSSSTTTHSIPRLFCTSSTAHSEDPNDSANTDDLKTRVLNLKLAKRSVLNVIQEWVDEGKGVTLDKLRSVGRELRRERRFKHALEISEWMVMHQEFELSASDYAIRIDLMTKVFNVHAAERYFEALPPTAKTVETYTTLLHCYAAAKLTESAESLFDKIKDSNIASNTLMYNEMMTLYISVGEFEKVTLLIEEMKQCKVSPDLFTYNLWVSVSAATMDIDNVWRILKEMHDDSNASKSWKAYRQLADIYITTGNLTNIEKTSQVVASEKTTLREWITYDFLILLYTALQSKEKVDQIWKSLRMTTQKMTSRNYKCILSSYLMLGELQKAGEVVDEWKQSTTTTFDIQTMTVLLNAFAKVGLTDKAESLKYISIGKNSNPTDVK